jgi:hypothetical protein
VTSFTKVSARDRNVTKPGRIESVAVDTAAIELAAMVAIGYGEFFFTACCYEIAGERTQSEYEKMTCGQ